MEYLTVRVPRVYLVLGKSSPVWPGYFKIHHELLQYIYHLLQLTGTYHGRFHLQFKPRDDRLELLCFEDKKKVNITTLNRPEYRFQNPTDTNCSLAIVLSDAIPVEKIVNLYLPPTATACLLPLDVHVSIHSFGPKGHIELLIGTPATDSSYTYFAYTLLSLEELSWLHEQMQIMNTGIFAQES